MRAQHQALNVFWIALGLFVAIYSVRLQVWQPTGPGSGFMPLVVGGIIFVIGLIQFFQEGRRATRADPMSFWPDRGAMRRVLSVLGGLAAITVLMEPLGFLASAVLIMLFLLCIVERQSWLVTITLAVASSVGVWWLFRQLDVILPRGPLGF